MHGSDSFTEPATETPEGATQENNENQNGSPKVVVEEDDPKDKEENEIDEATGSIRKKLSVVTEEGTEDGENSSRHTGSMKRTSLPGVEEVVGLNNDMQKNDLPVEEETNELGGLENDYASPSI